MIHTFIIPGLLDPAFDAWVDSTVSLITQYGDAVHGDDLEARTQDAIHLCLVADHLWRASGDAEPSWARLDVKALLDDLCPVEQPERLVSLLVTFVTFLCQRSILGPFHVVKLLSDLEDATSALGVGKPLDPPRAWASLPRA